MTPAQLALAAVASLLVCARAVTHRDGTSVKSLIDEREDRAYVSGKAELSNSCLYEGRWYNNGSTVSTREDCLLCRCVNGALSCRRRACAPLPDPLPRRCHVRHRRGSCCPELHCPDGVQMAEHGAAARFESEHMSEPDFSTPASVNSACVEGGTVYAAGSAMGSRVACEQCFCLRGARRCVRPNCLPPPQHCAPRPAPGACCPQRYYCDRTSDVPNQQHNLYDCHVGGSWVSEGDSLPSSGNCSACFCLRGEVRCQALDCAPALTGCRPLLAPGECCAYQYICNHNSTADILSHGLLVESPSTRYHERTFHSSNRSIIESTTIKIMTKVYTLNDTTIASATENHLIPITKVKRKTEEPPPPSPKKKPEKMTNNETTNITTTLKPSSAAILIAMPKETSSIDATTDKTTEQPEGTVKIVINGTINCTAELSSTSLPLSISLNDTDRILMEAMPRIPNVNVEAQTYSSNDIITDRNVNGGFDENDTFTINVTSSLMTNTSHSTSRPVMTVSKTPLPEDLVPALNSSKKTKGDYDYDYTEPTLPPSLPNLKIIPFVAADAVLEDEPLKEINTYPVVEREDKFPVYYPSGDAKDTAFPTRREDTYHPTQYPVFISDKVEPSYPPITHDVDLTSNIYSDRNELGVHEYTVSNSLGSYTSEAKAVTKLPTTSTTFAMETPAINLFSPPVETEGGFIPKGPGIIDEYFAVFPGTPSGAAVPHLTTSMQLDIRKSECLTEDGRRVLEGESISIGCLQCTCTWVELHCAPRECPVVPPGCTRLPPREGEPCCGDYVCHDNKTTTTHAPVKEKIKIHETEVEVKDKTSKTSAVGSQINITSANEADPVTTEKATMQSTTYNDNDTQPPKIKVESVQTTTIVAPITTAKVIPKLMTTTTPAPHKEANATSQEYDDDEDEEFSFGSVLKLLLSDNYETTTAGPKKPATRPPIKPTNPPVTPIRRASTVAPFIPLPPRVYNLPQNPPDTEIRIDHLVLGEATAIKRTTPRPITNKTTKLPIQQTTTIRRQDSEEEPFPFKSVAYDGPRPPNLVPGGLQGLGTGLLKLAGCNIYGRMYRVGRIIAELSSPCQECWCTEIGVQCKPLSC